MSHIFNIQIGDQNKVIGCDSEFLSYLHKSAETLTEKTFTDLFVSIPENQLSRSLQRLRDTKSGYFKSLLSLKANQTFRFNCIISTTSFADSGFGFNCVLIPDEIETPHSRVVTKDQFESIFENYPHPVYFFDLEGNLEGGNSKLAELFGLPLQQLIGMSYKDIVVPEHHQKTEDYTYKAINGEPGKYEVDIITPHQQRKTIEVTKFARYSGEKLVGVIGILVDLTFYKASNERWHQLLEQNPQPVQIFIDHKFAYINPVGAAFYKANSPDDLIGKSFFDFIHPDFKAMHMQRYNQMVLGETTEPAESIIINLEGESRNIFTHSRPITYKGKPAIQSVISDITEFRNQQKIIENSLQEKETLLKEIHHRVKNNLAVISGLLELQIMRNSNPAITEVLRDSQHRIHSIALVHQKLYQSESLNHINLGPYIENLIQSIQATYNRDTISVNINYEDSFLTIEEAVPCSLIVNEAVVNCYKHAFKNGDKGSINLSIKNDADAVKLEILDDGVGIPPHLDPAESKSLGLTLINILSEQLSGNSTYKPNPNNRGTVFTLSFPVN